MFKDCAGLTKEKKKKRQVFLVFRNYILVYKKSKNLNRELSKLNYPFSKGLPFRSQNDHLEFLKFTFRCSRFRKSSK